MLYVYKCVPCDDEFEVEQPITAEKGADCPVCKQRSENRLITGGAFILKGDCWAKDSYTKRGS